METSSTKIMKKCSLCNSGGAHSPGSMICAQELLLQRNIERERVDKLRKVLLALTNAVADAMESPEEAASWASKGDMDRYLQSATVVLLDPEGPLPDGRETPWWTDSD